MKIPKYILKYIEARRFEYCGDRRLKMTNFEKYKNELIRKIRNEHEHCEAAMKYWLPVYGLECDNLGCNDLGCNACTLLGIIWLQEEYKEPDWSEVEMDTPILVKEYGDEDWRERHFAVYVNGIVYAYADGQTSDGTDDLIPWKYAKLADVKEVKDEKF